MTNVCGNLLIEFLEHIEPALSPVERASTVRALRRHPPERWQKIADRVQFTKDGDCKLCGHSACGDRTHRCFDEPDED